jgi:integrase
MSGNTWETTHLTDAVVKRQPAPATGNKLRRDTTETGFALRVTANSAKSFVLNYTTRGGRERRYTIGPHPSWNTVAAREEARRLKQEIDRGADPLADIEDARAAPAMAELYDRFEAEHVARKREKTGDDYKRLLRLHIRPHFGKHTKVADVSFADCDALHRKVTRDGGPYAANRCIAVLSKMFNLAIRWKVRDDNPCRGVERNTEYQRRRYLTPAELGRLTLALQTARDQQSANAIRLLLLTGARRGEVLSMRWSDYDAATGIWSKPPSSTKQKEHHSVPLSAPARQLLAEIAEGQAGKHRRGLPEFVFPGNGDRGHVVEIKRSWRTLCRGAGLENLRLHDLRHSFASQLASGGAGLPLIGALLGHALPQTTARYAHLLDDPQRAAVERVGAVIMNAGKPAPEEPTPIKRGR